MDNGRYPPPPARAQTVRLHQTGGVGSRVEYGGQVDEFRCSGFLFWSSCSPTGRNVYVRLIGDFQVLEWQNLWFRECLLRRLRGLPNLDQQPGEAMSLQRVDVGVSPLA